MSTTQVWLMLKADSVSQMLGTAVVFLLVLLCIFNVIVISLWLFSPQRLKKGVKKSNVLMISLFLFVLLSSTLMPTTTELVKIHVIPVLVSKGSIEEIQKLPPKLLGLLNVSIDTLKDYLKGSVKK